MPKEDTIFDNTKIKYSGNFDYKEIYKKLYVWITQQGYSKPYEKKYWEKVKPDGKLAEFVWETTKTKDDYFKLTIEIQFTFDGLKEGEAEYKGKKIKLDNGRAEIKFNATLTRNFKATWKNENGLMFKIYEKYIIPDKIEEMKIDLYQDTNKLIEETKNYFNLFKF